MKIDTATTPAPGMRRACRISSRWPSCSAPIVGTRAMRLPADRSARVTGLIAAGLVYVRRDGRNAGQQCLGPVDRCPRDAGGGDDHVPRGGQGGP